MPRSCLPTTLLRPLGLLWLVACGGPAATRAGAQDVAAVADASDDADLPDAATPEVNPYTGKCAKGPGICDDGNPCTVDDCDPAKGCVTSIVACADEDPCTLDRCDTATGDCQHLQDLCDDGNACTSGQCLAGSGCVFSATDCGDGDACTSDGCSPATGCVHQALACEDGKACTADSCDKAAGCVHTEGGAAGCCKGDTDCQDGSGCSADTCDLASGLCAHQAAGKGGSAPGGAPCCVSDADCQDGNACTTDSCVAGTFQCAHAAIANCCLDATPCQDQNPCTVDLCNSLHQCQHTKLPGSQCCTGVVDCDDKNLCTLDLCPVVGLPCAHTQPDANCCMGAKDCNDQDPCTQDTCLGAQCGHAYICCASDADCNDGDDVCTNDSCVNLYCEHTPTGVAGCCLPGIFSDGAESGLPSGWSVSASAAGVTWQASQKNPHGGAWSLWYGNAATGNYDDGGNPNNGALQSPVIALPPGAQLQFSAWVWLDTETGPPYDELTLSVTVDGKTIALWTKHTDKDPSGVDLWKSQTWYPVNVNLSAFAGKQVVLTWKFDTVDGVANSGQGVFLDDMALTRSCAPFPCAVAADCDDKLPATQDGCAAGSCTYAY